MGEFRGDRILTLQGQLEEDGIRASIRRICTVLGCHRSNVYYRSKAKAKRKAKTDVWLVEEIRKIIKALPEYGTRRITAMLRRRHGISFNRKKIHRIIKERG